MRTTLGLTVVLAFIVALTGGAGIAAEYKDTDVLLSKLKDSKRLLADGIRQAGQEEGYVISAKFEMEGDDLSLSVYTAKEGRETDAEHSTLMELSGDPTKDGWTPKKEVFTDKEHIARASMHLTLMQLGDLKLVDVIKIAQTRQPGFVYSANPAVRYGRPVVDVLVATPDNKSVHLIVDILNGNVAESG